MGGRPQNESERILLVENLTEANAHAISKLSEVVTKLSEVVAKEDDRIKSNITQLMKSQSACEERHRNFMSALANKKEVISELREGLKSKASKEDVKAIRNALFKVMWAILGGVGATIGSALMFYLQHSSQGG